jgi:hypothetical protein
MMRILLDKLEERMKGTPADGTIQKLFVGKIKSYIRCINISYESSREEDFYDLQVPPPVSLSSAPPRLSLQNSSSLVSWMSRDVKIFMILSPDMLRKKRSMETINTMQAMSKFLIRETLLALPHYFSPSPCLLVGANKMLKKEFNLSPCLLC